MRRFLLQVMFILTACAAGAQECSNDDFSSFCETKAAVLRLLSYPSYTNSDKKILNRAGDMAALAVIKGISIQDLDSSEKARQVLLILKLAFEAPQFIPRIPDRRPTAAMLLLNHLSNTTYGREDVNEIENIRAEIQHNTGTGQPYQNVTLGGEPPLDAERTQWRASVLRWTYDIKTGMTRKDLLRVYTVEGGLSTRKQRTYVMKGCPYVKIDVEFVPVGNAQDGLTEDPNDRILKISKPYLDYSITD